MRNRIFIERTRHMAFRRSDKKDRVIFNQKITPRRAPEQVPKRAVNRLPELVLKRAANQSPGRAQNRHMRQRERVPQEGGSKTVSRGNGAFQARPVENISQFLITQRSTLLWISLCLILCASLIPLYINLQSFFWEKRRTVKNEGEVLYNLFLDQGAGGPGDEKKSAPRDNSPVPGFTVKEYTVRGGDSLLGIAGRFGVSVDGIISASGLKNAGYLKAGTVLRIPSMKGIVYRVKPGDSLAVIARKYNVSVNNIADINDLASETIQPGQELFVPGGSLTDWERAIALGSFFKCPARGRITSKVGFRIDPFTGKMAYHAGVDFAAMVGTPVRAAQYGRVSFAGYYGYYGKTVILVHPDGYRTLYAHLNRITVKQGQAVMLDEKIGSIGNTGRSTGPHLHFEVHRYKKLVDPLKVMKIR